MSNILISIFARIFAISMTIQLMSQAKLYDVGHDPISHAKIPLPPPDPNVEFQFEYLTWINSDLNYKGLYVWLSTFESDYDEAIYECANLAEHFEGVKYYDELEYDAADYHPDHLTFLESNLTRDAISELLSGLTPKVTMGVNSWFTSRYGLDKTKQCAVMVWKQDEGTYQREDAACDEKHVILCTGRPVCYQKDYPDFHEKDQPGNCTRTW